MVDKNEGRTAVQERRTNGPPTPTTPAAAGEAGTQLQARGGSSSHAIAGPLSPFAFIRRFAEDMDHLFEDFEIHHGMGMPRLLSRGREILRRESGLVPADWSPKVDVKERDGKFIVRADLPGMTKDGVKAEVHNGVLTIQGERRQESKEEHEGRYYSECSYGTFCRSIPLPEGVDPAKAEASFRDGVLEVTIPVPKQAAGAVHSIPVRS